MTREEKVPAEQLRYAALLNVSAMVGLSVLFVTYLLYVFGVVDPWVPIEKLKDIWSLETQEYLHQAKITPGWTWVTMARYGDFLTFFGVALLASLSILCYCAILPVLLKKKDYIYALLVAAEVGVLTLAASGVLTAGH